MMKKNPFTTLLVLPFVALLMMSCNNDTKTPVSGSITLDEQSKATHTLAATDTTVTIAFKTTDAWSATSDSEWITFSPKSGNAADVSMTITVGKNTSTTDPRSGKVRIICGQNDLTINITQSKAEIAPKPEVKYLMSKTYILGTNVDTVAVARLSYDEQGRLVKQFARSQVDQVNGGYQIEEATFAYSTGKIIITSEREKRFPNDVDKSTSTATAILNANGMIDTYQIIMPEETINNKFEYTDGYMTKITHTTTLADKSTQIAIITYTWKDGSMIKVENSLMPKENIEVAFASPGILNNLAGTFDISASQMATEALVLSTLGYQGITSKYTPSKMTRYGITTDITYELNDKGLIRSMSMTYPGSVPRTTHYEYIAL